MPSPPSKRFRYAFKLMHVEDDDAVYSLGLGERNGKIQLMLQTSRFSNKTVKIKLSKDELQQLIEEGSRYL